MKSSTWSNLSSAFVSVVHGIITRIIIMIIPNILGNHSMVYGLFFVSSRDGKLGS